MANFQDIIEFLRINRRSDEANKNINLPNNVLLTPLEGGESYHVDRNIFESNFIIYKRLFSILSANNVDTIYLWENNSDKKYLFQKSNLEYSNLLNGATEFPNLSELVEYSIETDNYNIYFYDVSENNIVIKSQDLPEIILFPDYINYNPNDSLIKDISNGEYIYWFKNHVSFFANVVNTIFDFPRKVIFDSQRMVNITKSQKSGKMNLFPFIQTNGNSKVFTLKYTYYQKEKQSIFTPSDEDCALILNFKSVGAFLSFLNDTIFSQGIDLSSGGGAMKDFFKQQFKKIVLDTLALNLKKNSELYYYDALEILYYLPDSISVEIDTEILWLLVREGVNRNNLTNKLNIAEEDIYIKLLQILLERNGQNEIFLTYLNTVLVKKKITILEFLYDRLNGDNGLIFAGLVNKAWQKSRFVDYSVKNNPEFASTTGPKLLPYHSEKIFGFFTSNASAEFVEKPLNKSNAVDRVLQINFETGKTQTVVDPHIKGGLREEKIVEHYIYHPFYPVKLKFTDKDDSQQETAVKLDAIIPAFMLKVNADKQFWHNVIKSGEYALDVAAIVGSYGTLSEIVAAEVITSLAVVRGIGAAAGITSSVANIVLKLTNAENSELGQTFCEYLFWIEMLSLSGELTVAIKNGLSRSARKLVEKEDDLSKLERQLNEALIEENGKKRKLTKEEQEELLSELHGKTGMADNIPLLTTEKAVKEFKENWKRLSKIKITPDTAMDYFDEVRVYFNHIIITKNGEEIIHQVANNNCTEVVKVIDHYFRTGEIKLAKSTGTPHYTTLVSWLKQEHKIDSKFVTIENAAVLWTDMANNEMGILLCLSKTVYESHHVIYVVKDANGKVRFLEGQNFSGLVNLKKDAKFKEFRYMKVTEVTKEIK
ncbi:hypothetical protein [Chryseobacterium sp. MMS23-Vi53]|uniref:hypothetical protein n=1 Tax=Chryseobacterium sp. MMS23-Vi53 TaxID=3386644 RepID=UPI0039E72EFE